MIYTAAYSIKYNIESRLLAIKTKMGVDGHASTLMITHIVVALLDGDFKRAAFCVLLII